MGNDGETDKHQTKVIRGHKVNSIKTYGTVTQVRLVGTTIITPEGV